MLNTTILASAQILSQNLVLNKSKEIKERYFNYLLKYIRIAGWQKRKYIRAQLIAYAEKLLELEEINFKITKNAKGELNELALYLIFDICAVVGYDNELLCSEKMNRILNAYYLDFNITRKEQEMIGAIIEAVCGADEKWKQVKRIKVKKGYVECFKNNLDYINEKPFRILVTATMSAGKSTFINALTGKNISLVQNMACTSKIHSIVGKLYEDNFSYEYDYDLVMNAEKEELLEDNKLNISKKIWVSTYFNGDLGGRRIIINDSPGVNFSENKEHKEITEKILKSKKYDLLIYLMNATQLGTNDNDQHLEYVKKVIGRKPVLFVINKIDAFNSEEEDVMLVLEKQIQYLKAKGFKNPVVCPVSSIAGYLSKKSVIEKLGRVESRELYCKIDGFAKMKLEDFYKKHYSEIRIKDTSSEEIQLQKTCGLKFIELMINIYNAGGKINGTNLY